MLLICASWFVAGVHAGCYATLFTDLAEGPRNAGGILSALLIVAAVILTVA